MTLLNDLNHLTFITADLDRLIAFYAEVFDTALIRDMREDGLRHAFIAVGPHTMLHPFEIPGIHPPGPQPMFQRGRLDHFAFNAANEEAFREIYRRAVARGACDGEVTDMGPILIFTFIDPDGGAQEVVWTKPGARWDTGGERSTWKRIELE
jgi:catechol 2,3-dioxygenase-like lactoylglutathione lyase family enzyme